ncbi:MAG TPA: RDD family protein [Vicinamibacterales bacterium]|nr:RDD family protein [Vicinamibacterales bacterium]
MPAPENLIIDTPEQISLEFPFAGVGSRFLALAFDTLLQAVVTVVLIVILLIAGTIVPASFTSASPWLMAGLLVGWFIVYAGYFALFESMWTGQTPGKRLVGLRVIDVSGRPLSVYSAILRNVIRIIDQVPGIYAVGILSVLITRRQQRLGDLAAGTVVVHERSEVLSPSLGASPAGARHGAHKLGPADIILIEGFLRRRHELDSWVRLRTARRIVERMTAKLQIGAGEDEERLLEELAAEYRSVDRYR